MHKTSYSYVLILIILFGLELSGCKEDVPDKEKEVDQDTTKVEPVDTTSLDDGPVDFSQFSDTYPELASADLVYQWRHYNVHDPAYLDDGEFVYCYNTDVAFGTEIRPGIQIRRSINLVEWEYVGWVLSGIPSQASNHIQSNGGIPNQGLWAPYAMKVGDEYRIYYSLASNVGRLSAIGLAVSNSPRGPFSDKGIVVKSFDDSEVRTNAIDPSVVIAEDGKYYMYYGSSWDGIYRLELNPETGLSAVPNSKGVRVAHRGFTGNTINGNIEGPEIIFNEELGYYYLFIAYDWLETKYNVRVGRSQSASGPFYDLKGNDLNEFMDDAPMILAPYKFENQSGWQGVSHPGVFKKDGNYYIGHQGRPGENRFYMIMHTRQLHWTEDGWPLVSSQRYATEEETAVDVAELAGTWEYIDFDYRIVPGFAETQTAADFQISTRISFNEDGSINGDVSGEWTYESPWMTLSIDGLGTEKVLVERGRDWENSIAETILFTGKSLKIP